MKTKLGTKNAAAMLVFSTANCIMLPMAYADPERLPGITVTGSRTLSEGGFYGFGFAYATQPPQMNGIAPEPEGAPELVVSNKATDTRCANANTNLQAITSRDDAIARELAANRAASVLKTAYAAQSLVSQVISWLTGNGGFKKGDFLTVTYADGGQETYKIENPSVGSNTIEPGSGSNLIQGNGVAQPTSCAA